MLVVLAAVGLLRLAPLLGLGATACLHAAAPVVPAGIHLGVLSRSGACPQHTFSPGANFAVAVHLGVLALVAALVVATIVLLRALGAGPSRPEGTAQRQPRPRVPPPKEHLR